MHQHSWELLLKAAIILYGPEECGKPHTVGEENILSLFSCHAFSTADPNWRKAALTRL